MRSSSVVHIYIRDNAPRDKIQLCELFVQMNSTYFSTLASCSHVCGSMWREDVTKLEIFLSTREVFALNLKLTFLVILIK